MTVPGTVEWLAEFQARFSEMLRTPLDASTGTLRVAPEAYGLELSSEAVPGPVLSSRERLALYNRQYWFRLFGVLQNAFPLTARLFGYFRFNEHAARFFLERPPQGWDIDRAVDGFDEFLSRELKLSPRTPRGRSVPREALLESVAIDVAWRQVFAAPLVPPFRLSAEDAQRLPVARLIPSSAATIVEEHWSLVELRRTVGSTAGEEQLPLPNALYEARFWAFVRRPGGIGQLPLDRLEARLFLLLGAHPVAEALALLETSCSNEERAALPERAQRWLARSVELDFWSGIALS